MASGTSESLSETEDSQEGFRGFRDDNDSGGFLGYPDDNSESEGFRGFPDDNGESEKYCRRFNRTAKLFRGFPMDPVVRIKRLTLTELNGLLSRECRSVDETVEPNEDAVLLNEGALSSGSRREALRVPSISSDEVSEVGARRCLNFSSFDKDENSNGDRVHVETADDVSPLSLNDPDKRETVDVVKSPEFHRLLLPLTPCFVKLKRLPNALLPKEPGDSSKNPTVVDADLKKTEVPEKLVEIDISNGLTLKSFCQLKSINIDDSDDESSAEAIYISSDDEPAPSNGDLELKAIPENPFPSGVEALTELGFLDNEPFQLGKGLYAENIWSDVLNFGELDDPCVEKPIEVDNISGKVTISRGFDPSLETVEGESLTSEKELLMSDPLNCNGLDMTANPADRFGSSDFLDMLISPEKLKKSPQVHTEENVSNDTIVQVRKRKSSEIYGKEGPQISSSISVQQPKRILKQRTLQLDRQSRVMEYRKKIQWMTQRGKNDVTSAQLYRDLSAIPYVLKCSYQNRIRRCHNLYPCANANKEFRLYFTLTIGVGRRLSQPLLNTIQTEDSIINKTSAYIAASAVLSKPTTILIPAEPETIRKVLPINHANLLMQLVNETEEIRKMAKKTISDKAIADMLKFKRSLMEMRSTSLDLSDSPSPELPQKPIKPSTPRQVSSRKQVKPTKPPIPQADTTNQIISVNTKKGNKFNLQKNSMVSLIHNSGRPHIKGNSLLQKRSNGSVSQLAAPPLKKVQGGSAGKVLAGEGVLRETRSSSCTSGIGSMDSEESGSSSAESEALQPLNKTDLVFAPGEINSVDITREDHQMSKWGAVCPDYPELGFVSVQKWLGKLLLCDKSVAPQILTFESLSEMGMYLNSRLVNPRKNITQSKMSRQWVLVSSGFVNMHNIPPTTAQFWISPNPKSGSLSKVPSPLKTPQGSGSGLSNKPNLISLQRTKSKLVGSSTLNEGQRSMVRVVYKPPGGFVQATASTPTTCVPTIAISTPVTSLSSNCLVSYASSSSGHSTVTVTTQSLQVAASPRTSAPTTNVLAPHLKCPTTLLIIRPPASTLRSFSCGLSPAATLPRKPPSTIRLPVVPAESTSSTLTSCTVPSRSPIGQIVFTSNSVTRVPSQPITLSTAHPLTHLLRNRPILIVRNNLPTSNEITRTTTSNLSKFLSHAAKTKFTSSSQQP